MSIKPPQWMRPQRVDLMFLVGLGVFISQAARAFSGHPADGTIVYAAIALMGIPVFARLENNGGGGGGRKR